MIGLSQVVWSRSSRSASNNNCVEVAADPSGGAVLVRDSKRPNSGMLAFPSDQWRAFTSTLRTGTLDR